MNDHGERTTFIPQCSASWLRPPMSFGAVEGVRPWLSNAPSTL
jgi:hypothetical protein